MSDIDAVAIVGCGVIGRSWALVFARAGCETRLYDPDQRQLLAAGDWIEDALSREGEDGVRGASETTAILDRVSLHIELLEALEGVGYVQESAPERMPVKQSLYAELDAITSRDVIIGSSTSTFDMSLIAGDLAGAARCVVAHPVNPPHQLPVVEILGGTRTTPGVIQRTAHMMAAVGQRPVILKKFAPGFVLNRLQFALVREAMHLVQSGVADVDAIDTIVHEGLGLRWALLGPFGVAESNNDSGIRGYYRGHEQLTMDLMNDLGPTPAIDDTLIEQLGHGVDCMLFGVSREQVRSWRDRMIRGVRELKASRPLKQDSFEDPANDAPLTSNRYSDGARSE